MDEPFGALDPQTRWGMQRLLLDVSRTEDNTILFVTHDVSEAVYLADTVYVLSQPAGADSAPRRRARISRARHCAKIGGRVPRRREAAARPALRAPAALHVECEPHERAREAVVRQADAAGDAPDTDADTAAGSGDGLGHSRHGGGFREERALRQAPVSEVRVPQPVQPVAASRRHSRRPASRSTRCSRSPLSAPRPCGC